MIWHFSTKSPIQSQQQHPAEKKAVTLLVPIAVFYVAEAESFILGLLIICRITIAKDLQPWEKATETTGQIQKVLFSSINERVWKLKFDYFASA